MAKKCGRCAAEKPMSEFYAHPKTADRLFPHCKSCHLSATKRSQAARRAMNNELKLMVGCKDCGFRGNPRMLEWDHLPQFEKLGQISHAAIVWSISRLDAEIAKCEVVCRACHHRRGMEREQFGSWANRPPVSDARHTAVRRSCQDALCTSEK